MKTKQVLQLGEGHHAVRVLDGAVRHGVSKLGSGSGTYFPSDTCIECLEDADLVWFSLVQQWDGSDALSDETLEVPNGPALFRLDEVRFPQGAIAYRHVHAGPGTRVLIQGELEIKKLDKKIN